MREWWTAQPIFWKLVDLIAALPAALYLVVREGSPDPMGWGDAIAFGLFIWIAGFNAVNVMRYLQDRPNG